MEECVNDTCMRAWNAIPPEKPRSLEAYLVRITRNLALDRYAYHHSQKRETALTEAYEELEACLPLAKDGPEEAAMVQELQRTLNDFLRAQPEDARRFSCGATGTARASPRSPRPAAQAPGASAARCSAPARGSAGGWKRKEYFYEAGRSVFPPDARRGRRSARGGHAAGAPPQARLDPACGRGLPVHRRRAGCRAAAARSGPAGCAAGRHAEAVRHERNGGSCTLLRHNRCKDDHGPRLYAAVPADSQDVVYSLVPTDSDIPWRRYVM